MIDFLLSNFLYIGERDRQQRARQAAEQVIQGNLTPEQASERFSAPGNPITVDDVQQFKGIIEVERQPQQFNVGRGSEVQRARARVSRRQIRPGVYRIKDPSTGTTRVIEGQTALRKAGFKLTKDKKIIKVAQLTPSKAAIDLFRKQGWRVKQDAKTGAITAVKGNKKVIISSQGTLTVPRGAKTDVKFIKDLRRQQVKQIMRKAPKKEKKNESMRKLLEIRAEIAEQLQTIVPKERGKVKRFLDKIGLSKLKGKSEKVLRDEIKKAQKLQQKLLKRRKKAFSGPKETGLTEPLFVAVGLGVTGLIRGSLEVGTLVVSPVKTAKQVWKAIKDPGNVLKGLAKEFSTDPIGLTASFYSFNKGFGLLAKSAKATPLARVLQEKAYLAFKVPAKLRKTVATILKAERIQRKIKPINVAKIKNVTFMDVKEFTKFEAIAAKKAIIKTDAVVFGSKAAKLLGGKKLKFPKDLDLAVADIGKFNRAFINALPRIVRKFYIIKGQKVFRVGKGGKLTPILDVKPLSRLIPNKSVITGKGVLPVPAVLKKVKITAKTKATLLRFKKDLKQVIADLKKAKPKTKRSKSVVASKLLKARKLLKLANKQGLNSAAVVKAIDKKGFLESLVPPFIKKGLGVTDIGIPTGKIQRVGKIRFTGFGEQTTRKALGTLQVLIEKNVRRAKDPQALLISLEVQLETLMKTKPLTAIGRLRLKGKIKGLRDAIKLLKSKQFSKLLESRVPGITKEFPLINKINPKKLKNINPKKAKSAARRKVSSAVKKRSDRLAKIKKGRERISKKKKSKLSRESVIPSNLPSKLRSKLSSLLRAKRPSKLSALSALKQINRSSLIPIKQKSQLSRLVISKLFKIPPSKLPASRLKSIVSNLSRISKLSPSQLSKIPISKVSKLSKVPRRPGKTYKFKLFDDEGKKTSKFLRKSLANRKFEFIPDLVSRLEGRRATKGQRKRLLAVGRVFTGLEARPLVGRR